MSILKSIAYYFKESQNPLQWLHAMMYGMTVTYIRFLDRLLAYAPQFIRNHVQDTYHSKLLRLEDAKKLLMVEQDMTARNLEQVLPFTHARDLVIRNPYNIVVYQCACRAQQKNPCQPTDVCLIVGEPFADMVRLLHPLRTRRITQQEAVDILQAEHERGHFHTAWFKTAMLNRFYAICNCCKCCCMGMKFLREYQVQFILPSGYLARVSDACRGCGRCAADCPFDAIEMVITQVEGKRLKRARVLRDKCYGCGVCELRCEEDNISLVLDSSKGVPLDIRALA